MALSLLKEKLFTDFANLNQSITLLSLAKTAKMANNFSVRLYFRANGIDRS